ncbi:hypothetical protein P9112_003003 [Eukaryota sp. TZLM1-RC]
MLQVDLGSISQRTPFSSNTQSFYLSPRATLNQSNSHKLRLKSPGVDHPINPGLQIPSPCTNNHQAHLFELPAKQASSEPLILYRGNFNSDHISSPFNYIERPSTTQIHHKPLTHSSHLSLARMISINTPIPQPSTPPRRRRNSPTEMVQSVSSAPLQMFLPGQVRNSDKVKREVEDPNLVLKPFKSPRGFNSRSLTSRVRSRKVNSRVKSFDPDAFFETRSSKIQTYPFYPQKTRKDAGNSSVKGLVLEKIDEVLGLS